MKLKDILTKESKDQTYDYYTKIVENYKDYEKVSRSKMYAEIIDTFKNHTEIILDMCSIEELDILKKILNDEKVFDNHGYLEYLLVKNLESNYLIIKNNNEYHIPEDIVNYIKMALNIFDSNSYKDVTECLILGLIRINNCLEIKEFSSILADYNLYIMPKDICKYITNNYILKDKLKIVKYSKKEYIVSLENYYYIDVINLINNNYKRKKYSLESVISIGKYKINLFDEGILKLLNFLECHLEPKYIDMIIGDLVIYAGFNLNDDKALKNISDNITELYEALKEAVDYFPIWIYKGNTKNSLKENLILPDKNDLCICGSGKKFKHCCYKFYK